MRISGYSNWPKTESRALAWEIISAATPDYLKKEGWVLALAGTRFLDRKQAARHGFKNIIGVDASPDVVRHNTERRRAVIEMDLGRVLESWPDDRPIAAIGADFCGNMMSRNAQHAIRAWMIMGACREAMLYLNVMKGREAGISQAFKNSAIRPAALHRATALVMNCICDVRYGVGLDEVIKLDAAMPILSQSLLFKGQYVSHRVPMNWGVYKPIGIGPPLPTCGPKGDRARIAAKLAWHTTWAANGN